MLYVIVSYYKDAPIGILIQMLLPFLMTLSAFICPQAELQELYIAILNEDAKKQKEETLHRCISMLC